MVHLVFIATVFIPSLADTEVRFDRDILPILSQKCLKCHGLDEEARKGKLRLDHEASARNGGKSGIPAIVPGNSGKSELYQRIISTDASEVMPPAATKVVLSATEKNLLKKWLDQGAKYEVHWAFRIPETGKTPNVSDSWARNPIDAFIIREMKNNNLSPAPEADRWTLVRRVYLDLIGIPPTPQQALAFIQDSNPDAHEKLVDELLASPKYGERWARRWLDLARYADTNGYEKDRYRSIWPWRDWLIGALNANMPFDQFSIMQLAGDLLPGSDPSNKVATGFHRNTMLNEEGGIDPLEFKYYAMVDRVNTTAATWLGLTMGCAQCHSHKYDPINHHDYYSLMAFLNNADDVDYSITNTDALKPVKSDTMALRNQREGILKEWKSKNEPPLNMQYQAWVEQQRSSLARWETVIPVKSEGGLIQLKVQSDGSLLGHGDISKQDVYELAFTGDFTGAKGLRLEVLPDDSLPAGGPGMCDYEGPKGDFFLGELEVRADGEKVHLKNPSESYFKNHFGNGRAGAAQALDGDMQTGWSCAGKFGQRHEAVFEMDGLPKGIKTLQLKMTFGRHYACPLGRFRISITRSPAPKASSLDEIVQKQVFAKNSALDQDDLILAYLSTLQEFKKRIAELEQIERVTFTGPSTLVLKERPQDHPRKTFLRHRGEYLSPTREVQSSLPAFLEGAKIPGGNRLDLAQWMFSGKNPLTARVTANRAWHAFFGVGIVRTLEDFGVQGEYPSHPELLDWLALELVRSDWSLKKLHKTIVTSATYRQASSRKDGQIIHARLLNAFPRTRLEAEMIRDTILSGTGLLSEKMGGPSVYPQQPAGVTTEGTYGKLDWTTSPGEDRYRRGLYTFMKRTAPYAMFATFDAPTGEACLPRREVSNSPLQALSMLNDPVIMDAAVQFGIKVEQMPGDDRGRIEQVFLALLTRLPSEQEVGRILEFRKTILEDFESGRSDFKKIVGEKGSLQQASWAMLVRTILNLDEGVTKR